MTDRGAISNRTLIIILVIVVVAILLGVIS